MAHHDDTQHHAVPLAAALSVQALQRYIPADRANTLLSQDCSPRLLVETFVQLASARYAISTYLPRHLVARQLATTSTGPWLEWVDGSLLFADVSGSTALADRLTVLGREGTEIVTSTLNASFDAMIGIIEAAGGDLLTFGGDALLVLFRGPQHAHIATRAALDLLHTCGNDPQGQPLFQRTIPKIGTFALNMHIGVESGHVALASAGHPESLHYSALGSTVNSVARAESYGGAGELIVGPNTWAQIAAAAEGEAVALGYVRVRALLPGDVAPAMLPRDETIIAPPEQAIPQIVSQLDRISPYLPAGLLSRILIDPQRPRVEADLRPVTVLFAQVVGLGPLVEALMPARSAAVIDTFVRSMQTAVERFGGVVNKLDLSDEGDKLLVIFGAPVAYEDHAERAARAALAMQEALSVLDFGCAIADWPDSQSNIQDLTSNIMMRVGLNTGNVFAGNVGTATRKEYTVMGDAVNIAARVMVKAGWGEVWCSAATAMRIVTRLTCEDRGFVPLKGKGEPLQLLRLVGEVEQAPAQAAQRTPLVGRQAELAWLHTHLEAARAGQGRVVRISGEAGVGKSRLTTALLDRAYAFGVRVIGVNCLSYATNIPYAPWGEWLKAVCGIAPGDTQAARAAKLAAQLARLGDTAQQWRPLLADLVRLDVEDNLLIRALEPQQRQTRRFELLTDVLRAAGEQGAGNSSAGHQTPLLVLFEDLHWADQVSLDLWRYMAARIADVPVLMLGVHRPQLIWQNGAEVSAPAASMHNSNLDLQNVQQSDGAYELILAELSPEESEALLDTCLGGAVLGPALREQIVTRAAGNPLFLEELLRAVIGTGQQIARDDSPQALPIATPAALDELPDSLNGLLLARIDRLDENSRALLRVAAVIGQRFPFGVLQSIHPSDQRALLYHLSTLDAQQLTMLERETPERVHLFRHTLVQEVAYQSLLYARRRELHRRIGEYLERYHAADLDPYYGLLAHHYRLSDRAEKAVTYLLLAGHAARAAYANDEAMQYYRWALESLRANPTDPHTWEARAALGDVLCTVGRYDEALAEYAAVLAIDVEQPSAGTADSPDQARSAHYPGAHLPPAVAAEVLRSRGNALERQGQYAAALEELDRAETLIRAHLDTAPPLLLPLICADQGAVFMRLGEYERAMDVCTAGLSKLRHDGRSHEDERIEAILHSQIGTIYGMRGDYPQARFHFASALAAQESIGDLYRSSITHNNTGYLWQLQSEYARAIEHYAQAEALARKINAKYVLSGAQLNLAYAYYCLGQYDQAEAGCRAALLLCEEMRDQPGIAHSHDTLGLIAYNRGEYDQALAAYTRALALYRELGSSYQEGNTLANMASVYNALLQPTRAIEVARQAGEIAERLQARQLHVEALNALAEASMLAADDLRRQGDSGPPADDLLAHSAAQARQAADLAEELGSKLDYGVAQRLLGQTAARRDMPYAAHFLDSIAVFTEIKNRFELARTQVRFAEALLARHPESAVAYLKQARQTFKEIGAGGELARLTQLIERSS